MRVRFSPAALLYILEKAKGSMVFDPKYGHTRLQLCQMRGYLRMAATQLDLYELEITPGEEGKLREGTEELIEFLDKLIEDTETDIEIDYLERTFEQ